jgi:hypothetical protein
MSRNEDIFLEVLRIRKGDFLLLRDGNFHFAPPSCYLLLRAIYSFHLQKNIDRKEVAA